MLIFIEVILTIFVWRKGWNWLSLIPLGAAFVGGFLFGMAGGDPTTPGLIFGDVIALIALVIMLINPPKKKEIETPK